MTEYADADADAALVVVVRNVVVHAAACLVKQPAKEAMTRMDTRILIYIYIERVNAIVGDLILQALCQWVVHLR